MHNTILVTGANGQLGSVLVNSLQIKFGQQNVIASDITPVKNFKGVFERIDATDTERLQEVVLKYEVNQIYHLAAILSANGEKDPLRTWDVNMRAWLNILETARTNSVEKVFFPSSIAVFGESAPSNKTPNDAYLDPSTAYGISKAAGENWGQYYFSRYGLDVRSLRYPGVIGYQSLPGGGTTDYAVDIYHKAVLQKQFTCFLKEDIALPMIFIDDAIRATIEIMDAPKEHIKIRTSYNIGGASFTPQEMVASIQKIYPDFKAEYNPDYRHDIAVKWPRSIDDHNAYTDWGWRPVYGLSEITKIMTSKLQDKYETTLKV